MKAAVIGAEGVRHIKAYREQGIEVVCLVDPDRDLRSKLQAEYSIGRTASQFFHPSQERESASDADVVSVCVAPERRFEMVKILLEMGKTVICDPPVCVRMDHLEALVPLAAGKRLGIVLPGPLDFAHVPDEFRLIDGVWTQPKPDNPDLAILDAAIHLADTMVWAKQYQIGAGQAEMAKGMVCAHWSFADQSFGRIVIDLDAETRDCRFRAGETVATNHFRVEDWIARFLASPPPDNLRQFHAMEVAFNILRLAKG